MYWDVMMRCPPSSLKRQSFPSPTFQGSRSAPPGAFLSAWYATTKTRVLTIAVVVPRLAMPGISQRPRDAETRTDIYF